MEFDWCQGRPVTNSVQLHGNHYRATCADCGRHEQPLTIDRELTMPHIRHNVKGR